MATKFGHRFHGQFERSQQWSASEVAEQLEASLAALQTDYVDLYQFHSGSDEAFDNDELWRMLAEQVDSGRIRRLGISIGKNRNIHQTSRASRVGAGAIQVVYNRLDRAPEEEVFGACREQDLGVLARVPLASGYLSGKYRPGDSFSDESDTRSRHDPDEVQRKLQEVEQIRRDEMPENVPMAAWDLAWCLRHPAVTCVIPGCKSVEQVESNALAAELAPAEHPQAVAG